MKLLCGISISMKRNGIRFKMNNVPSSGKEGVEELERLLFRAVAEHGAHLAAERHGAYDG